MAVKVLVLESRKFRARTKVCPQLAQGIERTGDKVVRLRADAYQEPIGDAVIFYGFDGSRDSKIAQAFDDYRKAGKKAIYVDLGYFNPAGRYGYHRFSINARHPNAHFRLVKHPQDRADAVGVKISKRMQQGENILLCGCSTKAAAFDGVQGWERLAIDKIRLMTDRPIVYRPKPQKMSKPQLPPIEGVRYSNPAEVRSITTELQNCWAVVSHHSNAGLDALCLGVPCFQDDGAALELGLNDLSLIEKPFLPTYEERRQLMNDVCYTQFNAKTEFSNGLFWRHFKDEGLVP